MTNDNEMSLPNYILKSMAGAWKLVSMNRNSMDYFDLSSDGFWKSFWALGVMVPAFLLEVIYGSQAEVSQPLATKSIYFVVSLPLMAIVMLYFTRFMKISINYAPMVIAYNWLNAMIYSILIAVGLILNLLAPESAVTGVVLLILSVYFGWYVVWHTLKISLAISGMLAVGVLLFVNFFNAVLQVLILKIFNPEVFDMLFNLASTQPS
tara:strand:+ start:43073 stop:43696 length:624 start_codon:yes stop_codon:yes gene_type:complete